MTKYKVTLTAEHCLWLRKWIEGTLGEDVNIRANLAAILTIAALGEVAIIIKRKELVYNRKYRISFSPVQALALCFLFELMPEDYSNDLYNRMMQINSEVC